MAQHTLLMMMQTVDLATSNKCPMVRKGYMEKQDMEADMDMDTDMDFNALLISLKLLSRY